MHVFTHGIISSSGGGSVVNPLWDGLLAYYKADGTPNDALGNYNGVLTNGATYGTGIIGQGFSTDGVASYIDFGTSFPIITGDMTLSFWFKGEWKGANAGGLDRAGGGSDRGFIFGSNNTGTRLDFFIAPTNSSLKSIQHSVTFSTTDWNHIVGVFKINEYMKLFHQGVEVASTTSSIPNQQIQSSSQPMTFLGTRNKLDGIGDELAIFTTAKTSAEVSELWNSGNGLQYPN